MAKNNRPHRSYDRLSFQIFISVYVTVCMIFVLIPLYLTIINSLKTHDEVMSNVFAWTQGNILENIKNNFSMALLSTSTSTGIYEPFLRTMVLCLLGAFGNVALGSILAYMFSYKDFPFKNGLFLMLISVMLLPGIMGMPTLVPLVKNTLNLSHSIWGYLLPTYGGGQVPAMFLFRTFFGQQPKSLYESARIEGANDWYIYIRITLPLAFAIILYQFVGSFNSVYNDYLWPSLLYMSNEDMHTVTLVLRSNTDIWKYTNYGAIYAMYILSSVPLIITSSISMKYFSGGDFAAGMKL